MLGRVFLIAALLFTIGACSNKAKDELEDAMNGIQPAPAANTIDFNDYEQVDSNKALLDLPDGSFLLFTTDLIIPQGAEYKGFNVGVYLQDGTPLTESKITDIDVFGNGYYCILTMNNGLRPPLPIGVILKVLGTTPITQYTTNGSFDGLEVSLDSALYNSIIVRGRSVNDLTNRCLGARAEAWVPKI